jgi:drug/metabolite transporter (DMT)-like permease
MDPPRKNKAHQRSFSQGIMDTGLVYALIAAVVFAVGIVMVRKAAGDAGEAFTVTAMSIFAGIPFFAIAISVSGGWSNLAEISSKALVMLAAAGIIHFVIGRLTAYEAFRLIGANRATPITQISPVPTVILSWIFLQENPTLFIIFGVLCMMAGVFLISQEKSNPAGEKKLLARERLKGILLSLVAALCWGITPVLIKPAVEEVGSAVVGNLVTYAVAGICIGLLLISRKRRDNFKRLSFKKNILPMALAGLFTAAGQLFYFTALQKSPANVIAPLVSIEILFIYVISFFVNRRSEVFTLKVALGMAAMVAGTFLLFR